MIPDVRRLLRRMPETYIAVSQLLLGTALLLSLAIRPHYFFSFNQGGVSNYGTDPATRLLFTAGFMAVIIGSILAAMNISTIVALKGWLQLSLSALSLLYIGLLLSTYSYKLSDSWRHLHEQAAIGLFVGMFALSYWLRMVSPADTYIDRAFIVFCIGLLLGITTFIGLSHVLFSVQLMCGGSFAYIVSRGVANLNRAPE